VIGVLVSGEGTNLQALVDADLPVAAVASNRIGAPALDRAERAGIPTAVFELDGYASRDDRDAAMAGWLAEHDVDLVVCAGYMHLLTERFLERFPQRIVNVHPALLPRFPGVHPIHDALAAGVSETGATVHFVDDGVDTGPVIRQERVRIEPGDTVESVRARVQAVEHKILPAVVRELIAP
jgi:phosphoribosylglycinamide formyltransferase-1